MQIMDLLPTTNMGLWPKASIAFCTSQTVCINDHYVGIAKICFSIWVHNASIVRDVHWNNRYLIS